MKQLLVDTNIILDLLANRDPFYQDAAALFTMADEKKLSLFATSVSIINSHYVIRKQLPEGETRKVLRHLRLLLKVLPVDQKVTDLALNSGLKDFEDAIQYFTAIEWKMEFIITRNLSDFHKSKLPVMTAGEFIHSLSV